MKNNAQRQAGNASPGETTDLKKFSITIIREAGTDGAGGPFLPRAEETVEVEAVNLQQAYVRSHFVTKLNFFGQLRRTFIEGTEYFDERC